MRKSIAILCLLVVLLLTACALHKPAYPTYRLIPKNPGSVLIPLGDVPKRYEELDPADEIVVHCKMGGRSAKAADFLRSVGFKRVLNLKGGILDWVDKVDPSQPKY